MQAYRQASCMWTAAHCTHATGMRHPNPLMARWDSAQQTLGVQLGAKTTVNLSRQRTIPTLFLSIRAIAATQIQL